jgi:hypothetical protein
MGMVPISTFGDPKGQDALRAQAAAQPGNRFGKWVGGLFEPPKLPDRAPPPLAPDATDAALQAARSGEILRQRMMRGRSASFTTGPNGVLGPPPLAPKPLTGS